MGVHFPLFFLPEMRRRMEEEGRRGGEDELRKGGGRGEEDGGVIGGNCVKAYVIMRFSQPRGVQFWVKGHQRRLMAVA